MFSESDPEDGDGDDDCDVNRKDHMNTREQGDWSCQLWMKA